MSSSESKTASTTALILAFATIYLVWGSTYLGMRVAVETMPPFVMAAGRFLLSGVILYSLLRWRGVPAPTRPQWVQSAIIGTLLLVGGNGLVAWALHDIPSGIAALLIGISPAFFVLIEWAWPGGKRPSWLTTVGLVLGFVGAALLAAPWDDPGAAEPLPVMPMLMIISASLIWAFGSIYSRHAKQSPSLFMAAAMQMLSGGLGLLLAAWALGELATFSITTVSARSWWAFAYLVMIGSLVGYSTFVWLMKHSTPARVSTYAYVNPVVAVLLGWWLLDEPVDAHTLISAAVIVTAVVLITAQKNRANDG